mgnify:CR=1 FL=1
MSRNIPCPFCADANNPDPTCAGCHGHGFIVDTGGDESVTTAPAPVRFTAISALAGCEDMADCLYALDADGQLWVALARMNTSLTNWKRVPMPETAPEKSE